MSFPLSLLHTFKKPIPVRKGWVTDGIGHIPLTQGLLALVDPSWVPLLERWNWCAVLDARSGEHYAKRVSSRSEGLPRKHIHMARVVLGMGLYGTDFVPDHINRNKLDNRRENLRESTNAENLRNRGVQRNSTTGFTGVYLDKRWNRYTAKIKFNRKYVHLGCFATAEEAHARYCEEARKLFGEFYCAA
jgi:hypothetical protein